MSDLIHKIVGKIIEVGQSDTTKFRLGETIRYSPSEILEILKQHENEIFGEESSTQPNTSNTLNALDTISRQAAIDEIEERINAHSLGCNVALISELNRVEGYILHLPSAQPEITLESAIDYLHSIGWMQEHDKILTESAQPEPKKGKWKRTYLDHEAMGERPSILYCSECSQCIAYPTNYCPNCGAKMEGE